MPFQVFTRTWWRWEKTPQGRVKVPHFGKKSILGYTETKEEAQEMCKKYNDNNDPGELSRKAEFTSDY